MSEKRTSITPTYDHRETGDRYAIVTRVGGRLISNTPLVDPFVFHRVTIGWRDLARGLLRRRLIVQMQLSGDSEIVEDVLELNADYLGTNCTRRDEFNASLHAALSRTAE